MLAALCGGWPGLGRDGRGAREERWDALSIPWVIPDRALWRSCRFLELLVATFRRANSFKAIKQRDLDETKQRYHEMADSTMRDGQLEEGES